MSVHTDYHFDSPRGKRVKKNLIKEFSSSSLTGDEPTDKDTKENEEFLNTDMVPFKQVHA